MVSKSIFSVSYFTFKYTSSSGTLRIYSVKVLRIPTEMEKNMYSPWMMMRSQSLMATLMFRFREKIEKNHWIIRS